MLAELGEELRDLVDRRTRRRVGRGRAVSAEDLPCTRCSTSRRRPSPSSCSRRSARRPRRTGARGARRRVDPQTPRRARHQRRAGWPDQRARGKERVGEADAGGDARGLCPASASWIACASGSARASGRCRRSRQQRRRRLRRRRRPRQPEAIRRVVESVRKIFTGVLSRVPRPQGADRTLKLS